MQFLLTSGGISNPSIKATLVELLGKPIAESRALFIPTAIYALASGPEITWRMLCEEDFSPFCKLGWKSLGVLELTALPSVKEEYWVPRVQEADVLLVGGGDCQYLTYWMQKSGLANLLPGLRSEMVYVGLSAGSMILTSYGTTYGGHNLPEDSDKCLRLFDFALLPHLDEASLPDNSFAKLERLAATIPVPTYVMDDQTAIKIVNGVVEVISEGDWKLFTP